MLLRSASWLSEKTPRTLGQKSSTGASQGRLPIDQFSSPDLQGSVEVMSVLQGLEPDT